MTVRLKVVNQSGFNKGLDLKSKKVNTLLAKAVRVAATETRNVAVKSIVQNSRGGGTVTRYNPQRTINISAPGDPPASDTGFLASNIFLKFAPNGLSATVESSADYSAALEFGTRHMQARPFLQPALEQGRKKYERMFAKAVKDAI